MGFLCKNIGNSIPRRRDRDDTHISYFVFNFFNQLIFFRLLPGAWKRGGCRGFFLDGLGTVCPSAPHGEISLLTCFHSISHVLFQLSLMYYFPMWCALLMHLVFLAHEVRCNMCHPMSAPYAKAGYIHSCPCSTPDHHLRRRNEQPPWLD